MRKCLTLFIFSNFFN